MSSNKSQDESGKLSGRVAIITGSSSGMGRAIALALAEEGASIVCADLQPEASPKGYEVDKHIPTHDLISLNGGRAVFQKCDLGKTEEIVRLVQLAVEVSLTI
jgi:NAD(P)-dependent dehydrogenase (short-subunit alcohol dehydrogenase family)